MGFSMKIRYKGTICNDQIRMINTPYPSSYSEILQIIGSNSYPLCHRKPELIPPVCVLVPLYVKYGDFFILADS
jgi:hypothetical protein